MVGFGLSSSSSRNGRSCCVGLFSIFLSLSTSLLVCVSSSLQESACCAWYDQKNIFASKSAFCLLSGPLGGSRVSRVEGRELE